jgi:hypothetical protein
VAIRGEIRDLLSALASPDDDAVVSACHIAGLLLERQVYYAAVLRRVAEGASPRLPQRYDELRRLVGPGFVEKVHDDFAALLPEQYTDVVLADDEKRSIADALVAQLSGTPKIAAAAANAFVRTDCVSAVPKLTEMLWHLAATDAHAAHAAIAALDTIISRAIPAEKLLSAAEEQMIANACAALRFAAASAVEDPLDPRDSARSALTTISQHFGRSF